MVVGEIRSECLNDMSVCAWNPILSYAKQLLWVTTEWQVHWNHHETPKKMCVDHQCWINNFRSYLIIKTKRQETNRQLSHDESKQILRRALSFLGEMLIIQNSAYYPMSMLRNAVADCRRCVKGRKIANQMWTQLTLSPLRGILTKSIDSSASGTGTAHAIQTIVAITAIVSFISVLSRIYY